MKITKSMLSVISCVLVMFLLCSCNTLDIQLSEGQIEDIVSQLDVEQIESIVSHLEEETDNSSTKTNSKSDNASKKETSKVDTDTSSAAETKTEDTVSKPSEAQGNNSYVASDDLDDLPDFFYDTESYTTSSNSSSKPQQSENICKITSLEDLQEFANTVRCGHSYQGEQVTLEADIDLSGMEWTPIGSFKKPFKGTFSGKGHTISNLTVTSITDKMTDSYANSAYVGFFGYAEDAIITGLNLENVNISLSDQTDVTFVNVGSVVGYMIAKNEGIKLTKCKASGTINVSTSQDKIFEIGGLAGGFDANHKDTFYNMYLLYSSVNITVEGFHSNVGGIAGTINSRDSDASDSFISDMIYIGNINEEKVKRSNAGGLIGLFNSAYRCDIKNCFAKLTLNRVGFNSYTELMPNLGIIIGDQCVGTAELGLENIYGCVLLNEKIEEMSFVGRTNNQVYYKNCFETDRIPDGADTILINWNLTDSSSPTIDIEKH